MLLGCFRDASKIHQGCFKRKFVECFIEAFIILQLGLMDASRMLTNLSSVFWFCFKGADPFDGSLSQLSSHDFLLEEFIDVGSKSTL